MHKDYPYLRSSYIVSSEEKMWQKGFLSEIDDFVNQKQYVRITLLDWLEEPIKEIQGELTSGSISKDASSPVRRTCNFQASVNGGSYDVSSAEMDFAINKKIFLEIGIKNYTKDFPEFPILWFPQGVFFISSFSMNSSTTSAVNLSIGLKDKMCGLNGEVGGKFPATTILDEMDTQSASGKYIHQKIKIYDIIKELVNHFGGESLNNIVIEDVPLRIKRVMKWTGDNPLYLVPQNAGDSSDQVIYQAFSSLEDAKVDSVQQLPAGSMTIPTSYDAGYVYDDFIYTGELTMSAGDTVASALDRLIQYMGNYEYFYDEFGVFHFREKKNYMNTTQAKNILDEVKNSKLDYLVSTTTDKNEFAFNDDKNLMSINATPQYENIKNDYVIQGLHKITGTDISYPIRYHLAIDRKPQTGNTYHNLLLYKEPDTDNILAAFPQYVPDKQESKLPDVGNFNVIYGPVSITDTNEETGVSTTSDKFFYWDDDVYKEVNMVKYYRDVINEADAANAEGYTVKDWRTETYIQGLLNKNYGLDQSMYYYNIQDPSYQDKPYWVRQNYENQHLYRIDADFYFEELEAFWPQMYDLERQQWIGEAPYTEEGVQDSQKKDQEFITLCEGRFYLDFIDPSDPYLGQFAVNNIGRRSDVVVNEDINCLFQPTIPNIVFINIEDENAEKLRDECIDNGMPYSQVRGDIYWAMATGGYRNGAFDQLKYELYLHTNYQKVLSLTALPAFYLEPNTRVSINDKTTNTYGSFIVQNITIPLGAGSAMSVSINECFERYF